MSPRPRPAAAAALLLAGVAILSGCSDRHIEANDVDAARVADLQDALPFDATAFDAKWIMEPASGSFTSVNTLADRGGARALVALDALAPGAVGEDAWAQTWPAALAARDLLSHSGWAPVYVSCEVRGQAPGRVHIVATKAVGDVTAMLSTEVGVGTDDAEVEFDARVPFHTEPSDPWEAPVLDEPTCLDAGAPPDASASTGDEPAYGRTVTLPED